MAAFDADDRADSRFTDDDVNVDRGPHRFLGIPNWLIVIALTLVAGVLRFSSLDKPSVWGDEAATWRRITGTYPELVQELRIAGFMPAHYLLTWWIKDGMPYWGTFVEPDEGVRAERERWSEQMRRRSIEPPDAELPPGAVRLDFQPTHRLVDGGITPSPFVLRFIPALCGTLMVPAMYFLASQLVARRTALLVALFTCCSAYLLGYSRDAKMYMQFWFFATLHVGCLLWWLSAYRRERVTPAASRRSDFPKQDELGIGVAGVLPGQHVGHIARAFIVDAELRDPATPAHELPREIVVPPSRLATLVRWACWVTAGLAMIAFHAIGLAVVGIELLILLVTIPQRTRLAGRMVIAIASPVLYVIDRVRERKVDFQPGGMPPAARTGVAQDASAGQRFRERLRDIHLPPILGFAVGALAILSLWSSYKDFTRFYDRVLPDATNTSMQVDTGDAGISWVEPFNRGRTGASMFLYNASAYLMSWEWVMPHYEADIDPRALMYLKRTAAILFVAILLGLLPWRGALNRLRPNRVKRERTLRERGPMPATAFLLLAAWLLVPTYGLYAASGAWRVREMSREIPAVERTMDDYEKVRAVTPIEALVSVAQPVEQARFGRPRVNDERPLQGALANEIRPVLAGEQTWSEALAHVGALPWSSLLDVRPWSEAGRPSRLPLVLAGLALGTLFYVGSRWAKPGRMLVLLIRGIITLAVLLGLLIFAYLAVPMQEDSIWMPRYAGFVWPAFAIGVCVLIRRLPLAPLRWGVVVLLVGANLTNFVMRCRIGEPPTAMQAADLVASRDSSDVRFFGSVITKQFGGPGSGSIYSLPFVYYCAIATDTQLSPARVLANGGNNFRGPSFDAGNLANGIRGTLNRAPEVTRFDVWLERPVDQPPDEARERIARRLPAWELAAPVEHRTIYDHWTWRRVYTLERQRWQRATTPAITASPARAAATRPATTRPTRPARRTTSTASAPAPR